MIIAYTDIPTYNYQTDSWSYTSFPSQKDFAAFLDSIFKEPGQYEFDECTDKFDEEAKRFDQEGYYCDFPYNSKEYIEYWNTQKERCRKGAIYINGDKQWYVTRDYYDFLNFCPLINKERGNAETFADIRDVQYHLSLYEKRAEAHHKHALVVKKRQMASSYLHTAKMYNAYKFERKAILRNLASDEKFLIGETGIWNYYNSYRDFNNENTGWFRNNQPNKDLSWVQRIEVIHNGRKTYKGRKSVMVGITLKKSPTAGVGGPSYYNYYEEAGISPKLDKTYIYMKSSLESGSETTGLFIGAGSVGELKDCKPLKKYAYSPEENGFLGVINNFENKDRVPKITCLYIPEQWGMPQYVDKYGNSLVEEALAYLNKEYEKLERELDPEDYQLTISQHPRYLSEAFANREISKFPVSKIEKRQSFLKDNPSTKGRAVELSEDDKGQIKWEFSNKKEMEYPVNPKEPNKEGVVIIYEFPEKNPKMFTYFGGVDSIEANITSTSESLFSVYIVKGTVEVVYQVEGKTKTRIEGEKIMASYTGRWNDLDDTNKQGEMLIRLYNAFSLCEKNKPNFINSMKRNGYSHLLARKSDIPIFKDLVVNDYTNDDYGIYMDNTGNMQKLADDALLEWMNREVDALYEKDEEGNSTGKKIKTFTVLDSIPDYWLLEELRHEKDNTDRRDALRLAVLLKSIYQANHIKTIKYEKPTETTNKQPQKITKSINFLGGYNSVDYKKPSKPKNLLNF